MFETAKKLFDLIDQRARRQFLWLLLPMLVVALFEMLSIGMIIPVIQVVLFSQDGEYPAYLKPFFPAGGPPDNLSLILTIGFGFLFALKSLVSFAMIFIINRTVFRNAALFGANMFNLYLHRPLPFHLSQNRADFIRNLSSGVSSTFEVVRHFLLICLDIVLMTATIMLLFFLEPEVSAIMAVTLGSVALAIYLVASPVFRHWGNRQQALEGELIKGVVHAFSSIRDIKLFNSYSFLFGRMQDITIDQARYQTYSAASLHIPRLFLETVVVVGFLLLVGLMAGSDTPRDQIVATLGVFGMAAFRTLPSLTRVLAGGAEVRRRSAYVNTLYEDWQNGQRDGENQLPVASASGIRFDRVLEISSVDYLYPQSPQLALKGINLSIEKGESVGFVGPSGSGKTTLMDIILGLLKPATGTVQVDGQDIDLDQKNWRQKFGFVPQQIYLLDDTVRRNIAFAIDDDAIDEARLEEVIQLAHLKEFVDTLPDGLDTFVGEQGTRISGGQRQRIAIARALYCDPEVLMFDEATSALDNESEHEISQAIEILSGTKTILIIAHRLSTVMKCDKIFYIQKGQIVDQGSFAELCEKNPAFSRMAALGTFET